jgi:hypothetical protein
MLGSPLSGSGIYWGIVRAGSRCTIAAIFVTKPGVQTSEKSVTGLLDLYWQGLKEPAGEAIYG